MLVNQGVTCQTLKSAAISSYSILISCIHDGQECMACADMSF